MGVICVIPVVVVGFHFNFNESCNILRKVDCNVSGFAYVNVPGGYIPFVIKQCSCIYHIGFLVPACCEVYIAVKECPYSPFSNDLIEFGSVEYGFTVYNINCAADAVNINCQNAVQVCGNVSC